MNWPIHRFLPKLVLAQEVVWQQGWSHLPMEKSLLELVPVWIC